MNNIEKIDLENINPDVVDKAVKILIDGGVVVYPTDTAYGLGVNALDETAIKKLYEIKGRDFSKPTHIVVRDWEMVEKLAYSNKLAKELYTTFMPGPLTIILTRKSNIVPDILTANLPTIGVRIPNNEFTSKLSIELAFPYTTPSANRSGEATPYSLEEAEKSLDISQIDLIIDAGPLPKTPPSTIVDLTTNEPKIIREGPITKKQIVDALGLTIRDSK